MWLSEKKAQREFEDNGWEAIRNGFPDWILVKRDRRGKVKQFRLVETKGVYQNGRVRQRLTPHQERAFEVLREITGREVEIIYQR